MVLLAVRMVADVTETPIVIPSLEFETFMTIKSQVFTVLKRFEFEHLHCYFSTVIKKSTIKVMINCVHIGCIIYIQS